MSFNLGPKKTWTQACVFLLFFLFTITKLLSVSIVTWWALLQPEPNFKCFFFFKFKAPSSSYEGSLAMVKRAQAWAQVLFGPKPKRGIFFVFFFSSSITNLLSMPIVTWWWLQQSKLGLGSKKDPSPSSGFLFFFICATVELLSTPRIVWWTL